MVPKLVTDDSASVLVATVQYGRDINVMFQTGAFAFSRPSKYPSKSCRLESGPLSCLNEPQFEE